ncbi:MAG: zinc ABC transporter substrate-binding protein [Paracoccaceae bacterium]
MRYIISLLLASSALPAMAEVPRVVTDIPPVHAITAQVMGELGQPVLLLDRGANAHNYQLRPSQAASLADAGLVIWIGPEMTPWMDRALDGLSPDVPRLGLLAAEGTFRRDFGDASAHDHGDDDHGHAAEATTEDHSGHDDAHDDHDEHLHTGLDPHAWLDPENAKVWAGLIAAELSRLDPENAATYAANAAAAQARVQALDGELSAMLAPVAGIPFVVYHDAYGYFASHYGLALAGSVALGDASAPGAARLRDLSQTVADGGALCLFPEAQYDPALVTQMASGTTARIGAALDPSGSTIDPGPEAYDGLMRALANNIVACLNG